MSTEAACAAGRVNGKECKPVDFILFLLTLPLLPCLPIIFVLFIWLLSAIVNAYDRRRTKERIEVYKSLKRWEIEEYQKARLTDRPGR